MGVTILQPFPVKENMTGAMTIEMLVKRVQALGGIQVGQFLVDCDTYASSATAITAGGQQGTKTLNILHNSEYPASTFALLEVPVSGPVPAGQISLTPGFKTVSLVADNLFDLLVIKMKDV